MALSVFGVPPDSFSLPSSATLHAVQASGLGLLSPQYPLIFCSAKVCTSLASSLRLHFVIFFSGFFGIVFVDVGCRWERVDERSRCMRQGQCEGNVKGNMKHETLFHWPIHVAHEPALVHTKRIQL